MTQEQIINSFMPLLLTILTTLIGILVYAVKLGGASFVLWMKSKAGVNQQFVIDRVAKEAHAFAERWAKEYGIEKLTAATEYASKALAAQGISISADKLNGIVQAAWYEANKAPATVTNTTFQVGPQSELKQVGEITIIKPSEPG